MEKQTIVITYVGERPSDEVQASAVLSFLKTINNSGTYVDATVNPTAHHFAEDDVAKVIAATSRKSGTRGISIKVEKPERKVVIDSDRKEKIMEFFSDLLNG